MPGYERRPNGHSAHVASLLGNPLDKCLIGDIAACASALLFPGGIKVAEPEQVVRQVAG